MSARDSLGVDGVEREWRALRNGEYPPPGPTKYGATRILHGAQVREILVFAPKVKRCSRQSAKICLDRECPIHGRNRV